MSVPASVVIETLDPAAIFKVSFVLSAAIVLCPDTAMFPKALSPTAVLEIVKFGYVPLTPIPVPAVNAMFDQVNC